jgi:hypothetical protein
MKRAPFFLLPLLLAFTTLAFADNISFSIVGTITSTPNLFSASSGFTAGPGLQIVVSDTDKHLQFPLTGIFNASTGSRTSVSSTSTSYSAMFGSGGTVTIANGGTTLLSGGPMFAGSTLLSNLSLDTGSFAGEFTVTAVDPAVLAMFGLGPKWNPDGSVSITFGQSLVTGDDLSGVLGAATVTIETPTTVPEPSTIAMFIFGCGTLVAFWHARQNLHS